ncbi:ABC transporter ATP-binding protein [Hamadaea tsunoensis]|uniref:ABC transporter ATP-binding protein n=1 Tax=Hamadaea tsunoensis TaxID=53368 RepID=UPI000410D196|nr:ABC transporter ATP-binding protein [Hamadaea tsunoensis]
MSISLTDVTVTYPDGGRTLTALDHVSMKADPGDLVFVTGPSGSGKSTLLAVAGALLTPDSGTVLIGGAPLGPDPARVRRERIGFVFQQANLLPSLTARDQLLLTAHLAGTPRRHAEPRARALLDRVGLSARADRRPHQLSGGEKQRVGLARALMGSPAVLLLDEPTSALDSARAHSIVELVREIVAENQVAALFVTHDTTLATPADPRIHLTDGHLATP